MCGIAGFLAATPGGDGSVLARSMADAIAHRGPDDSGQWHDPAGGVALGHRRLAIIDVSAQGHQPMLSACGRYVLVFNGEIYNHGELRSELGARRWSGHSDTETLLACFSRDGIERSLARLIGMFAFAVWDRQRQELVLARDRLGEKPLYFGWQGTGAGAVFLFGSELAALRRHPAFEAAIDRDTLCLLMRLNCIPAPFSIYRGIRKLLPGTFLTVRAGQRECAPVTYWSGVDIARSGRGGGRFTGSADEAVERLELLLRDAVGRQMAADVPLGAFLSGGIDSSTVVALMQTQSSRPVRTFSIGFREPGYDEAEYARAVAAHLGTQHTELTLSPEQLLAVIPRLPSLYDEPFADSSQIPTFLVSHLARQHVKVCLSGDGGDELFAGYERYGFTAARWNALARIPRGLRALAAAGLRTAARGPWPARAERLRRAADMFTYRSPEAMYLNLLSHWRDPGLLVPGGREPPTRLSAGNLPPLHGLNLVERMMALDMLTYLPDDILTKVDRAAMAVSLETRVPFLDHRVVEFAWSLPLEYKMRGGQTKWALRQVLYRHVPRRLVDRPKMGFAVPVAAWLRGPLRDWAEGLLDCARLHRQGFLDGAVVRRKWEEHLSGRANWQNQLWDVLMFQQWFEAHHAADRPLQTS